MKERHAKWPVVGIRGAVLRRSENYHIYSDPFCVGGYTFQLYCTFNDDDCLGVFLFHMEPSGVDFPIVAGGSTFTLQSATGLPCSKTVLQDLLIPKGKAIGWETFTTLASLTSASRGLCVDDTLNFEVKVRIQVAQHLGTEADARAPTPKNVPPSWLLDADPPVPYPYSGIRIACRAPSLTGHRACT